MMDRGYRFFNPPDRRLRFLGIPLGAASVSP